MFTTTFTVHPSATLIMLLNFLMCDNSQYSLTRLFTRCEIQVKYVNDTS